MLILWGGIVAAGYLFAFFFPRRAVVGWVVMHGLGTLLTVAASVNWGSRQGRGGGRRFARSWFRPSGRCCAGRARLLRATVIRYAFRATLFTFAIASRACGSDKRS